MRDIDVKGVRKLAVLLPKWLLPDPKKQGDIILKTIHGIQLHINPTIDNGVELCLFQTGTYEKGILNFIEKRYTGKGSFVDVGANIGLMSIFTADKFPKAKVYAIEAHPKTMELLERNRIMNTRSNIETLEIALGNESGEVTIYDNWQVNRGGASLVVKTENSDEHKVQMKRLDDLNLEAPEMIKIDVEGVELEVLKGGAETIRKHQPILIVEISDWRENKHDSSAELVEFIKTLGTYRIYKLSGGKERKSHLVEVMNMDDLPAHDNIVCIVK